MTNKLKQFAIGVSTLSLWALSTPAFAQDFPTQKVLPLELSTQAAMAAIKKCHDDGFKVSVAIVDQSGLLKVQLKADGAGPHTLDSSRRKAYTANSLRDSTHKYAVLVTQKPELQSLTRLNENILLLGGGFPIKIGGEVVGGIGVGGAPGIEFDEVCASAALKILKADDTFEKK
ncbi:MAG: heme-binding protein [Nitrosomonas sp.]|uniref:GlcG/HbpS family heme-binding protein n=1 Tax=Nitrosomonas sp. TaxID=42353 RepID=UPI002731215A|nr:heme-binding protein [Nitrosomonas sp.]MDP2224747.1 heme-binding protein [Nitrosomonas sp.]MDP3281138.1 heme-binding protein [Nitrosomonas sp.]